MEKQLLCKLSDHSDLKAAWDKMHIKCESLRNEADELFKKLDAIKEQNDVARTEGWNELCDLLKSKSLLKADYDKNSPVEHLNHTEGSLYLVTRTQPEVMAKALQQVVEMITGGQAEVSVEAIQVGNEPAAEVQPATPTVH